MSGEWALDSAEPYVLSGNDWRAREMLEDAQMDYEGLQELEAGNVQETYEFASDGDEYILQFSKSNEDQLENGINVLRKLQDSELSVPEIVDYDLDRPYVITRKDQGASSRKVLQEVGRDGKRAVARTLGEKLREVHEALEPESYGHLDSSEQEDDWRGYILGETEELVEDLVKAYPEHSEELNEALRRNRETIPEDPSPALIHNDFIPSNVILDGENDATVIDWDMALAGDPLLDISGATESIRVFTGDYEDEVDESFLEGYGIDEDSVTDNYRLLTRVEMMHAAHFQEGNDSGGFREPTAHITRISELLEKN